jgi:hypothetical protein
MEKAKNQQTASRKMEIFINEINSLKTLAQLGEGEPLKTVGEGDLRTENVRNFRNW